MQFRKLIYLALASGAIAGLLLSAAQHFTVFPLIEKAEVYESAAENSAPHHQADEGWRPADGFERTAFTVLTTILTAIGFAAVLFGVTSLLPVTLNWRKGLLLGLLAFACVDLAPALGLPPQPPGTAVADLYARQEWWVLTVVSTAIGLWLLLKRGRAAYVRLIGLALLVLPHVKGAPKAPGESAVPAWLTHEFAIRSILTTGFFWAILGAVGGLLYRYLRYADAQDTTA